MTEEPEILAETRGPVGVICLNRPKALNALSLNMIRLMDAQLSVWAQDDNIKAVFMYGAGDRAYCAGGDIKATYFLGLEAKSNNGSLDEAVGFFREEYTLNKKLFHYGKPIVAFLDGYTMGGGYGVSGPCRFRVACDSTVFAMPETAIGFFPDIGSTYFLDKSPGLSGRYLVVTGNHTNVEDMVFSGAASHYMNEAKQEELLDAMQNELEDTVHDDTERVLSGLLDDMAGVLKNKGGLETHLEQINSCFDTDCAEDLMRRLEEDGSAWAEATALSLSQRSPTSVKVALAHIIAAKGKSFDEVMDIDFTLAQRFLEGHDFYEGVRAMVVDKDRNPQWRPARLVDVTVEDVARHFMATDCVLDGKAA